MYAIGSRATRGVTLQVTDETGKPVEGAAVSFRLPEQGSTGVFGSGLKTEIVTTRADGRAAIWGMQWNKTAGPVEIRVTAVKEQARAGIVTSLYLSDKVVAQQQQNETGSFHSSHHRGKWLLILAAAGGAGAVGALLGAHGAQPAPAAAATTQPPQVAIPTITVGHP